MHELLTFPRGKYDDQVDSTAQALKWLVTEGIEPAMLVYYRKMAEERERMQG